MKSNLCTFVLGLLLSFQVGMLQAAEPSFTLGEPQGTFGAGFQSDDVTEPGNWRWSEKYYGFIGIDDISEWTDSCGDPHIYAAGFSQHDLLEYRMKCGGEYSKLIVRGLADSPGPVNFNVYIDGQLNGKGSWDRADNCNQEVSIMLREVPFGTHYVAIEFTNDFYDGVLDRNMYLDGLKAEATGTSIYVGDDLKSIVNASPPGATFYLRATNLSGMPGVHRLQQIFPKNGQQFIGEDGAVLNGAGILSGWVKEGNLWVHQLPASFSPGLRHGECEGGGGVTNSINNNLPCTFPEELFFNNRLMAKATSKGAVVAGTWFLDYNSSPRKVYLHDTDNPTTPNTLVELAQTPFAFGYDPALPLNQRPANVVIRNLIVEKYANPAQTGAIGYMRPFDNWVIEDNEVRWNHGVGIKFRGAALVRNNYIHHNGQLGIGCGDGNSLPEHSGQLPEFGFNGGNAGAGARIEDNEISYNNFAGFEFRWEAGGSKFAQVSDLTVVGNYVHHNNGPGLWTDFSYENTLYERNTVSDNQGPGIFHETSGKALITHNKVFHNSTLGEKLNYSGEIYLSTSWATEVCHNEVTTSKYWASHGIIVREDKDRVVEYEIDYFKAVQATNSQLNAAFFQAGNQPYGRPYAWDVYVHDNDITILNNQVNSQGKGGGVSGGLSNWATPDNLWLEFSNIRFDFNRYHLLNRANAHYWKWWKSAGGSAVSVDEEVDFNTLRKTYAQERGGQMHLISSHDGQSHLRAEYFNDGSQGFTSTLVFPVVTREDPQIDFSGPQNTFPADPRIGSSRSGEEHNFSARWTGMLTPQLDPGEVSANFSFRLSGDDGLRLWIETQDGAAAQFPLERWEDNPANSAPLETTTPLVLRQDTRYAIRVEYFHRGNAPDPDAHIKLEWKKNNGAWETIPADYLSAPDEITGTGLQAWYYQNPSDVGSNNYQHAQIDQQINFNWDNFRPVYTLASTGTFGVFWRGRIKPLYDGDYYFFTRYNGAIEDMEFWVNAPTFQETGQRYRVNGLRAGELYEIEIRFKKFSDAQASQDVMLEWESVDKRQHFQLVPPLCLFPPEDAAPLSPAPGPNFSGGLTAYYYNMPPEYMQEPYWIHGLAANGYPDLLYAFPTNEMGMDPAPVIRHDDYLNFDWRSGSPDYRIGADFFSAKWVGQLRLPDDASAGDRQFRILADDGVMLFIAGDLLIDTWTNRNNPDSATMYMEKNHTYLIEFYFYERGGSASTQAVLEWRLLGEGKRQDEKEFAIVPPEAFETTTPGGPIVTRFLLEEDGTPVRELHNGDHVGLNQYQGQLNIRVVTQPDWVESVDFSLNNQFVRTIYDYPYNLWDGPLWQPVVGSYSLEVTPYASSQIAGQSRSLSFSLTTPIEDEWRYGQILLFPNPTYDQVYLEFEDGMTQTGNISVFDLTGRELLTLPMQQTKRTAIRLGHLPKGLYLIRINIREQSLTQRILLQ